MSFVIVACSFGCTYGAIWHAAKNCASLTGLPFHGWSSIRQRMMSSGISPEISAFLMLRSTNSRLRVVALVATPGFRPAPSRFPPRPAMAPMYDWFEC